MSIGGRVVLNCSLRLNNRIYRPIRSRPEWIKTNRRCLSSAAANENRGGQEDIGAAVSTTVGRDQKISNAMRSYLERAKKQEEFLSEARREFDTGKRHLANMMGWDPETITQKDINSAIQYLMPSGLFNPPARPIMRPPEEIFPKRKAPQFDVLGKPFHNLFFTGLPNYYQLMHEIHAHYLKLNQFEDKMIKQGVSTAPPEARVEMSGSEWIKYRDFQQLILEVKVREHQFDAFISSLERLAAHPYSARIKDFFLKFRTELVSVTSQMVVQPLTYTEDGLPSMSAEGLRKHCVAQVTVLGGGTGVIAINGKDLSYFDHVKEREQIMFPLQFTGLLFKVDVNATVTGVGVSAQAGAIRHGLSLALRSFVETPVVEEMRIAGLLTKDRRVRERKKPGQTGARRPWTWCKR